MASESTEEPTLSVRVPAELGDWLEQQAATLDTDRETFLAQLLVTVRQTAESDGDFGTGLATAGAGDEHLAEAVSAAVEEALDERVGEQVDQQLQETIESVVTRRVSEATNSVQQQFDSRLDAVEDDYMAKIQDVRERVIQVKKETDTRASADHKHEAFETVEELTAETEALRAELDRYRADTTETVSEHEATFDALEDHLDALEDRLDTLEDRLKTVAWVVSDLRETQESGGGLQAVERIKRVAAKHDIERANCEHCGEGVSLALLTDPECPHCNAAVTNVEPAGGWFGKPKLLAASQLESGERS